MKEIVWSWNGMEWVNFIQSIIFFSHLEEEEEERRSETDFLPNRKVM